MYHQFRGYDSHQTLNLLNSEGRHPLATSILVGQVRRLVCVPSDTWHETEATPCRELSWASAPFSVLGCVASALFLWPLLCPCVD